jgi:putative ABC transport system ATP-binding protein
VGLADRAAHRPSELSGGQQQRVALARALITRPAVLFADEPTGALDDRAAHEVLALLRQMVTHDGRTVVMVTHDSRAASHTDRTVFLTNGHPTAAPNPKEPVPPSPDHRPVSGWSRSSPRP